MSLDFLLEVGCEEIPARFVELILEQLELRFERCLASSSLSHGPIETFGTPRRLILHIPKLLAAQAGRTELVTGPPFSAAFDASHNPTRAAEGFARKFGVAVSELKPIETPKGTYLACENTVSGKSTREILLTEIPSIFSSLELPKNMRWEESKFLFVRPIRWVLCLLNGETLGISLADVKASNQTFGHRILSSNRTTQVNNYEEYKSVLLNLKVCFDQGQRRARIQQLLEERSVQLGGLLVADDDLLNTVTYLNEWPSVIAGSFDSSYLRIPREVLITVMRQHQKYFSLEKADGTLLPHFLAVVDSDETHCAVIAQGHERVLKARLADASFFWDQDRKIPLESRIERVEHIVFQLKLGNMGEKSRRIGSLAQAIADTLGHEEIAAHLEQAARLCKTDLTTEMVKEFANLQGVMGGLYATAEDLPVEVADAIYEHYRPVSLEDKSPRSMAGALLSIADKLDSVIGSFSIGLVPSGSRDPLALRRQTLGLIKTALDLRLSLSLGKAAKKAFLGFKKVATRSFDETLGDFEPFVKERLKFIFREAGYRYDEINAVIEADADNPLDCQERLEAISEMRASQDFLALATSFKRIKNIITKAGLTADHPFQVDIELFQQEEETSLYKVLASLRPKVKRYRRSHQYLRVFELMASLRPQVDLFFDKVLVMADDPEVQGNRLGLLGCLWQIFLDVADISEIVVS